MLLGYSVYEIAAMFFTYGFLGWCVEVIYCGLSEGHFINRGFLNGPICPIYGVGGALVVLCLTPISHNLLALFAGSAVLTSALELMTGFALDKMFHTRWWDYSDLPFNIGGYICLKYSVYWGLVCIGLMKFIHPAIIDLIRLIPQFIGIIILIFLACVFIADIIITVAAINNMIKRMRLMEEIAQKIHAVSDNIGEHVYDGAVRVAGKGRELSESESAQKFRQKQDEMREKYETELAELKKKYNAAAHERHIFQQRIITAFPKMKSHTHNEQLERLKERLRRK